MITTEQQRKAEAWGRCQAWVKFLRDYDLTDHDDHDVTVTQILKREKSSDGTFAIMTIGIPEDDID